LRKKGIKFPIRILLISVLIFILSVNLISSLVFAQINNFDEGPTFPLSNLLDKVGQSDNKISYQLSQMLIEPNNDEIMITLDVEGNYTSFSRILEQNGFRTHRFYQNRVQGLINPDDIEIIASFSFIKSIQKPAQPVFFAIESQGVGVLKADIAHGIDQTGNGAKVAIIDGGFDLSNIEISANIIESLSFRYDGKIEGDNSDHGTACAEIVIDVAPDAGLYLYTIQTNLDFISAVNYAVSVGVDIISISVGFYNLGPYDGTSYVSEILENARNAGVLPIVAVGNDAERHWKGTFQDPDSNGWLNFDGSDETNDFLLINGNTVRIFLSWNDWWDSDQDYDLRLYKESEDSLDLVAISSNRQDGCCVYPTEAISFTASSTDYYHIVIYNYSANNIADFELFITRGSSLEYIVQSGSISNVADAKGAIAVGALRWSTNSLEDFSSRGPTVDGRIKPDISAPDGVQTTAYASSFFGTSAAAPHIAGIAALLVGSNPTITANGLASMLEMTAVDMGDAGKDNMYGAGRAETKYSTLDVSPRIVSILVDETVFLPSVLPRQFLVDGGIHHVSLSETVVQEGDTRYLFKKWSDGLLTTNNNILFDGSWTIKSAEYSKQYLLTIQTEYGTPVGDGWHDEGSLVEFSISSIFDQGNGTRRIFNSWTGKITSNNPSATVIMNNSIVVTAQWSKQYELTINPPNQTTIGRGWYDTETTAAFSADLASASTNDTRRTFKYWSGDFSGNATSGTILMNSPKTVNATWSTDYLLRINSPLESDFTGGGWYNESEIAVITGQYIWKLEPNSTRDAIKLIIINNEIINSTRQGSGILSIKFIMNQPQNIEVIGVTQHFLDIRGGSNLTFGTQSPTNDRWWDRGQSTNVSTNHIWNNIGSNSRQNLISYILNGTNNVIIRNNHSQYTTPVILITEPKLLIFTDITQYLLKVEGGHQANVTLSPTLDMWFDEESIINISTIWKNDQEGIRKQLDHWQLNNRDIEKVLRSEQERYVISNFVVNQSNTLRFVYAVQYFLEVVSPINIPSGSGWYDEGVTAIIETLHELDYNNQTRHIFVSWSNDINSEDPQTSFIMDSPKTVIALWKIQYYLQIETSTNGVEGEGWWDGGSQAVFKATPTVVWSNNTRHVFISWTGDVQSNFLDGTISMLSPAVIIANWKTQYFLEIVSPFGGPQGEGWRDSSVKVEIYVSDWVDHGNLTKRYFSGWIGDIISEENTFWIIITEPVSIEGIWRTQYYVEVISDIGEPQGEDWYDRGSIAQINIQTPINWGNNTRSVFVKWIGNNDLDNPRNSLTILSPQQISVQWKIQYLSSLVFMDQNEDVEIHPLSIQLTDGKGENLSLQEFNNIWLDNQRFAINELSWMGSDVKRSDTQSFFIFKPGEIMILTKTYPLTIIVRDLLTLPISEASISTKLANGTTIKGITDQNGEIKYSLIPLGTYSTTIEAFGQNVKEIGDASVNDELNVTIFVSLSMTILITISSGSVIGAYYILRIRK